MYKMVRDPYLGDGFDITKHEQNNLHDKYTVAVLWEDSKLKMIVVTYKRKFPRNATCSCYIEALVSDRRLKSGRLWPYHRGSEWQEIVILCGEREIVCQVPIRNAK